MNRLPRRPLRIQPPLRGRSASVCTSGSTQFCSRPVVRQRPPTAGPFAGQMHRCTHCDRIHPSFLHFYRRWPGLFKVLDRPWKWLVVLIALMVLSIAIGSLL